LAEKPRYFSGLNRRGFALDQQKIRSTGMFRKYFAHGKTLIRRGFPKNLNYQIAYFAQRNILYKE